MCSCVGYTENQLFDLLQDEFQKNLPIIIISQCVLCSIQNSKPGRVVVNFKRFLNFFREIKSIYFTKNSMDFCEISMLLLLSTYLQVLEMCRVVCFNIMVEKFQLPAVGYLPWPLPTSNFKKIQNSKICTHKIEKIRETATTTIFYPPLVWLSLSRARVNSSVISSSRVVTCITRSSSSFILGLRRLAAEEGTFSKKTWLQKIKLGSW